MFRSAIDRWLDDNQAGRPLKGSPEGPDLNKLIDRYRELQVASKIEGGLLASDTRGRVLYRPRASEFCCQPFAHAAWLIPRRYHGMYA